MYQLQGQRGSIPIVPCRLLLREAQGYQSRTLLECEVQPLLLIKGWYSVDHEVHLRPVPITLHNCTHLVYSQVRIKTMLFAPANKIDSENASSEGVSHAFVWFVAGALSPCVNRDGLRVHDRLLHMATLKCKVKRGGDHPGLRRQ